MLIGVLIKCFLFRLQSKAFKTGLALQYPASGRLSHAQVQEIRHDLSVLQIRMGGDDFITGSRLFNALEHKTGLDEQIQPLAERAREARNSEFPQAKLHFWWCGLKE